MSLSDDVKDRVLSAALWPVDTVTGRRGEARLRVEIPSLRKRAIRNLSGFYCFVDLDDGHYRVDVTPVGSDASRYLPVTLDLVVPQPDSEDPALPVDLLPSPNYPFPPASALIRGRVQAGAGSALAPVAGARVERLSDSADGTEKTVSWSVENGAFVIPMGPITTRETVVVRASKGAASKTWSVEALPRTDVDAGDWVLETD